MAGSVATLLSTIVTVRVGIACCGMSFATVSVASTSEAGVGPTVAAVTSERAGAAGAGWPAAKTMGIIRTVAGDFASAASAISLAGAGEGVASCAEGLLSAGDEVAVAAGENGVGDGDVLGISVGSAPPVAPGAGVSVWDGIAVGGKVCDGNGVCPGGADAAVGAGAGVDVGAGVGIGVGVGVGVGVGIGIGVGVEVGVRVDVGVGVTVGGTQMASKGMAGGCMADIVVPAPHCQPSTAPARTV